MRAYTRTHHISIDISNTTLVREQLIQIDYFTYKNDSESESVKHTKTRRTNETTKKTRITMMPHVNTLNGFQV